MDPIRTPRLILRPFSDPDAEAIFAIFSDEEMNRFLPWFPVRTMDEAMDFFHSRYRMAGKGYRYAICMEDDIPIGYIGIDGGESHDLGYGLLPRFWHRGIATEAASALLAKACSDGLPYATATHDIQNIRSGSVMKGAGMSYRYSYRELWQPKGIPVVFRMYQINLSRPDAPTYMGYWERFEEHFIEECVR